MQTSTNNTTHTALNQLVYEPVPPIDPSKPEGQSAINPINASGNLAEQAGPVLSNRQAQPIAIGIRNIRQRMYEADQLLKKGQKEEAGLIYLSISSNTDGDIRDRLSCAKKLLKISSIYAQALSTANLLVEIVKDPKVEGADRLEAIKILAKWPRFQYQAVLAFKAFSAVFESQAIEPWVQNAAKDCIVPLLFSRIKDHTVLSFDRVEAAEELSKLLGEDRQGEIWAALLERQLSGIDGRHGMKIAERLSKISGYEDQAVDYLLPLARNRSGYIFLNIKAAKKLAKIPGYETTAAEILSALSEIDHNHVNHHAGYFNRCKGAEILSAIPGQEEKVATIWLAIAQEKRTQGAMLYAAQKLSRMPGQESKAKEAWLCLAERKEGYAPGLVICRSASATALLELFGEKDKAVQVFIECAEDKKETPDRRMLAVQNLEKIPGQENKAEELKAVIEQAQANTANAIVAAKNHLQIPEEKEQGANDLLSIAKDTAVLFVQRMLAIETLLEIPEQHPKSIEALNFIARDGTLYQYHWLQAAEKLSKIPGQEENARIIVDSYVFKISDESRYFKW